MSRDPQRTALFAAAASPGFAPTNTLPWTVVRLAPLLLLLCACARAPQPAAAAPTPVAIAVAEQPVPKASPPAPPALARARAITSLEDARHQLSADASAALTELSIAIRDAEVCHSRELFDLLAASPQRTRLQALELELASCAGPGSVAALGALELPALRRLGLHGWIGPRGAEVLAGLPLLAQLEQLDLSTSEVQRAGLAALAHSPHLGKLQVLRLERSLPTTDAALALADTPGWTGLRELDLANNVLTREALVGLARNPALAGLERLDLASSIGQGDDRFTAFVRAGDLPQLRELDLGRTRFGDAALVALADRRRWSRLQKLDLSYAGLGPAGAAALARATHLDALEQLNLNGNQLGARGGQALAAAPHLAGLRQLDLTRCEIGDAAAVALLTRLRDPEVLRLAGNHIGDAGAAALAARRDWTGLRVLDISSNAIGDDGFVALAAAPQLASLERLDLQQNRPGERAWRALVDSRPLARRVEPRWREALALADTTLSPADAARIIPADLELELTRLGCFGSCPIFTVTLHADGRIEYRGDRFVRVVGPAAAHVDVARVKLILAALDSFLAAATDGACNVRIFDNENVAIRVRRDGRTVAHASDSLCPSAPAWRAIFTLADRISALLNTDRWTLAP